MTFSPPLSDSQPDRMAEILTLFATSNCRVVSMSAVSEKIYVAEWHVACNYNQCLFCFKHLSSVTDEKFCHNLFNEGDSDIYS